MALQGTIETFALPEVLRLLGSGAKTGRLRLSGDRGSGSIWIDGGKVVAAEATGLREGTSPVGVVFELLRYVEGSFNFDDDPTNTRPGTPQDIEVLLGDAERQLADWREIEAVIPSLAVRLALAEELPAGDVTLDAARWKAIVAVARGGDAAAIADALDLEELEGCRRAKDLVEAGLAVITELEPLDEPEPVTAFELAADTADGPQSAPVELAAEPDPLAGWDAGVPPASGFDSTDPLGGEVGAFAETDPVAATDPAPFATNGHGGHDATGYEANGYESNGFGAGDPYATNGHEVAAPPSAARAELDAMASGFGLTDPVPDTGGFESYDAGSFDGGGFESAPFESGGFESGSFDPAFATDPSEDPAFSFAAPDADPAGFGALDAPSSLAPGAALFAEDLAGGASGGGDGLFTSGPAAADDGGDAAEVARQLANLSPKAARAVAAAARATTAEEREAALAEVTADGDEPINRGLLLKFLSSVQT